MFEKINHSINNIKNNVSLKFINTQQRDKLFDFLTNMTYMHSNYLSICR